MEDAMVCVSTGVMKSLLAKVPVLDPWKDLKEKLETVDNLLHHYAMLKGPDMLVKEWMRQVREVAYDTEDLLDVLIKHGRVKTSKTNEQIEYFTELISMLMSYQQERIHNFVAAPTPHATNTANRGWSKVTIRPQLLHAEDTDLVAMDGPREKLVDCLMDKEKPLRVASIVGIGGLGKTTLANEVYRKIQWQFECQAVVYVGRNPSIRKILVDMLRQVNRQEHIDMQSSNEEDVIRKIREILVKKRYFIMIDDIWSISVWNVIKCALPVNDHESRIIITTRIHDVADSCSSHPAFIYEMRPLGDDDSKKLFDERTSGSTQKFLIESRDVDDNLLKMCGGLPCAIIVIAGLLACTSSEQLKPTISALEQYPMIKGMRKIFHISYTDLPLPMKSCLLYLSVFPKNYVIKKDRLIWRWIAEGLIPRRSKERFWETGENYFNELVNRTLIQPEDIDDDGQVICCTVHGVILDHIVSLSNEENFVTSDADSMPRNVIRRFSLKWSNENNNSLKSVHESADLSHVRSLTIFGYVKDISLIMCFQLLRVLDLEDAETLNNGRLRDIGKLFCLRYLGLGGKDVTMLPEEIAKLKYMETLEIRRTNIRVLPKWIVRLQKLVRLLGEDLQSPIIPIKDMPHLEELSTINCKCRHYWRRQYMPDGLRILGVNFSVDDEDNEFEDYRWTFEFVENWRPPHHLQKFVMSLNCYLWGIPRNMAGHPHLTYLEIALILVQEEDLRILGDLPALVLLKLHTKLSDQKYPIKINQGFESLKVFRFMCQDGGLGLVFEAGAMPHLQKLLIRFNAEITKSQHGGFLLGICHLYSLERVHATIDCEGATVSEVKCAEAAIEREVCYHLKKPTFQVSKYHEEKMMKDGDQGSSVEAEHIHN